MNNKKSMCLVKYGDLVYNYFKLFNNGWLDLRICKFVLKSWLFKFNCKILIEFV